MSRSPIEVLSAGANVLIFDIVGRPLGKVNALDILPVGSVVSRGK